MNFQAIQDFQEKINKLRQQEFIIREAEFTDKGIVEIPQGDTSPRSGELLYLIFPQHIGATWNEDNMIYRSSMWNYEGKPVSLSYKKFFNWGEKSNLVPEPISMMGLKFPEKIDGSTLIVSIYKGFTIIRTRGTFSIEKTENSFEIDELKKRYPLAFDNELLRNGWYSFIYEWVSPYNRIILDYGTEPDIYLTGVVEHKTYQYMLQDDLDECGKYIGVKRPEIHTFDNLTSMIETVQAFKGKEGVCVYFNDGQDIKKIKGTEYLALHAFKSEISIKNMIDLFLQWDKPSYGDFLVRIEKDFDYECMKMALPIVSKISDAYKQVQKILDAMVEFVIPLRSMMRKEAAEKIIGAYGKTSRSGFVFTLLDNKPITDEMVKKLLFQIIGDC